MGQGQIFAHTKTGGVNSLRAVPIKEMGLVHCLKSNSSQTLADIQLFIFVSDIFGCGCYFVVECGWRCSVG